MEQVAEILLEGARNLGLDLGPDQVSGLEEHLALLGRWNAKLNLVGPGTTETWAIQHTLDSLAVVPWIASGDAVADVGSGAGFPGIPSAILHPDASFTLIEPRANRAAFLQNALAVIGAKNARVSGARAAAIVERFQLVIGRAVAVPETWATMASILCAPGGGFVLFALDEPPLALGAADRALVRRYELVPGQPRFIAKYVPRGTAQAVS